MPINQNDAGRNRNSDAAYLKSVFSNVSDEQRKAEEAIERELDRKRDALVARMIEEMFGIGPKTPPMAYTAYPVLCSIIKAAMTLCYDAGCDTTRGQFELVILAALAAKDAASAAGTQANASKDTNPS